MLSELEHSILGTTTLGSEREAAWEGIHVIFDLARDEFPGVTFSEVVEALVKLLNLGYLDCQLEEDVTKPVYRISKQEILDQYGGQLTEEDIKVYPKEPVYSFVPPAREGKNMRATRMIYIAVERRWLSVTQPTIKDAEARCPTI